MYTKFLVISFVIELYAWNDNKFEIIFTKSYDLKRKNPETNISACFWKINLISLCKKHLKRIYNNVYIEREMQIFETVVLPQMFLIFNVFCFIKQYCNWASFLCELHFWFTEILFLASSFGDSHIHYAYMQL